MRSNKKEIPRIAANLPEHYRRSIAWLIALFSLLFVAICAIALIYNSTQVQRIKTEKENELTSIATSKVNEIEAWRNERIGDGLRVQNNPLIYDSMQNYQTHSNDPEISNKIVAWLENIRSANQYSSYFLLDTQANIILQDTVHPEKLDKEDSSLILQAVTENKTLLSDLHLLNDGKSVRLDLVAPISGQTDQPIAVVLLRIDPYQFLYPLLQSWPINSQTGETVLFRQEGDQVLYLNDLRFVKDSALKFTFPLNSPNLPAARALHGDLGPYEGIDYRGIDVLAVAKKIPETNWFMVAKEDRSEIYADLIRESWLMVGVLFIVLISMLSLAYTLIRRQRDVLVNSLLQAEIEKRNLDQKFSLIFEKGNDSIVIFDEVGKITDENGRAVDMYGYSHAELIQKNVKQISAPRDQNTFMLNLGQIRDEDGMRFEMLHRRKDGTIFPVDVSSRYYEVDGKGYYLNIIRDISEQKQNLELLKASESKYRSLVEHSSDGIFIADKNSKFIDVNDHGCEMVGYSRDELFTMTMNDIVAVEDKTTNPLRIAELTSQPNRMIVSERMLVRKDGAYLPVEIIAYGLQDGRMQGVVRDISDRVKHRNELEDAAERYRQLFDSNPLPLLVYDSETLDFLAVNNAAERFYGYSRAELLKMKMDALQSVKIERQKIGGKEVMLGELIAFPQKHVTKDGEVKDVEVTSHLLAFNGHPASLELIVDVTEKLMAENELKENFNALQSLINTAPLGIVTSDLEGNVTLWSQAAEAIFGWSAAEVLGKPYPVIPESSPDTVHSIVQRNVEADEKVHYEAERKRKDGTLITIDVNAAPLRDYRNQVKGMLALISDISEIKAVEQANKRLAEERYELLTRLRLQFTRMPIGFVLTDKNLNVLDWNPQAEKIFGYSRGEVIGKSQYDLIIPPEMKPAVAAVIGKVTQGFQTEVITHENITKDGRRIIVEWHNTTLYDENSNFIAIMAMAVDVTEKIKAEKQLLESEEKLRAFFEAPLVGILFGDIHGSLFTANDQILNIIGYSRKELESGKIHWDKITPPEFLPLDEIAIAEAQRKGVCTPYEKQYIRKDGKRIWVLVGFILLGEERENTIAFILDVSDRKFAEQSLIESEANYRGLFTHMMNGLAFCKMEYENGKPVDFTYLKTNESFERITRLRNADGKKVSELIPNIQQDNPEIFEIYGRVASTGNQEKFETYLPGLDIYFSVFVYSPKRDYFVALFEDVTEQKRAEAEIRSKQELLKMTGEIGKIGGWEIDVVKGTSSWTEEVARIQDLDLNTSANVDYGYTFYTPESRPIIEKAVNEAINNGKSYDLELEIISAKGVHKLVRTTGLPEIVDGKVVKITGIFQDITELKKTEAEIKKLNDELEQRVKDRTAELLAANQELESFSYSVSHDLRAPIRAIDGFSQIILDEYSENENPEVMRYLEIIRQNTHNMGNLVDDLLAFSRLGKQSIVCQTVNTHHLVNEVIAEIQQNQLEHKVEFVIGHLPNCQADVKLLKQVFVNLISNAVKFTRKCEHARVEIGSEAKLPPGENMVEKYSKYCYYVRDNGVGFDMRYYDKLFGVFQRLHKAEDYEGTGVGLAIVKRVVEKHGGKVWAESQLNGGTTFYFVLGEGHEYGKPD